MEEEDVIVFKGDDSTLNATLDNIFTDLIAKKQNLIAKDIQNMRNDVAESVKSLEESEKFMSDVMKAIEEKARERGNGKEVDMMFKSHNSDFFTINKILFDSCTSILLYI